MQLIRMGKSTVGEPDPFQKSLRIDNQRITFPFPHGSAVIQRVIRISSRLALLFASICIDDAVISIDAADQHEDPLMVPVLRKLNAVPHLELSGTSRWDAKKVGGIILQKILLSVNIQVARPGLEWRNFLRIINIVQKSPFVGFHI